MTRKIEKKETGEGEREGEGKFCSMGREVEEGGKGKEVGGREKKEDEGEKRFKNERRRFCGGKGWGSGGREKLNMQFLR